MKDRAAESLRPCPDKPNCVSSINTEGARSIQPFIFECSAARARRTLLAVLFAMKRTTVRIEHRDYIRAEVRTPVFRFADDLEFLFEDHRQTVQVRSASRRGYYDFGVNRRRVESIRRRFTEALSSEPVRPPGGEGKNGVDHE
jgi:uncharacterized protein (DUF1499 family)